MECRTNSKKHCMACEHIDYCDKANRCNGDCHICDDYACENNSKYKMKAVIDATTLYALCNKEQLFTCGTNKQYKIMFDLAREGIEKQELALILYICSDRSLCEINKIISPLFDGKEEQ